MDFYLEDKIKKNSIFVPNGNGRFKNGNGHWAESCPDADSDSYPDPDYQAPGASAGGT